MIEDGRAIARAHVVALAIARRGVVDLEEELEQVAIGRLLGVERDLDRLGMGAVVAIGGVGYVAARVSDSRGEHSGALADQVLHAPKAASCEDRFLGTFAHRTFLLSGS